MSAELDKQHQILEELVEEIQAGNLFDLNLKPVLAKLETAGDIWILGAGKASVEMALQAERFFGDRVKDGMIISNEVSDEPDRVQVFKGSHPYPDEDSLSASYELWQLASNIPKEDTVIFCLSGGASSLFCIPPAGIELEEMSTAYETLLNSGASIEEINTVRKHISDVGGGKLGALLSGHKLISVLLSDVPGDIPEVIGSGPTVPDNSSYRDAFHILKKYQLWDKVPHAVRIHISKGLHGDIPENPQKEDTDWKHHQHHLVSGAKTLADNTGEWLTQKGFNVEVEDQAYDMEVTAISKKICGDAISILGKKGSRKSPAASVYFGESTVNVKSTKGKGGRNQHLALTAAISLEGQHPVSLLSLATDGVDGPTDAAGAIVNSQTTLSARKKKLEPEDYLQNFDSYAFHKQMKTLIKTGPTGNNLMDLQVLLAGK